MGFVALFHGCSSEQASYPPPKRAECRAVSREERLREQNPLSRVDELCSAQRPAIHAPSRRRRPETPKSLGDAARRSMPPSAGAAGRVVRCAKENVADLREHDGVRMRTGRERARGRRARLGGEQYKRDHADTISTQSLRAHASLTEQRVCREKIFDGIFVLARARTHSRRTVGVAAETARQSGWARDASVG